MKNLKLNKIRPISKIILLVAVIGLFSLSSCLKNNDNYPQKDISAMAVINASPGLVPFDFVLENQLLNNGSFEFTNRYPYFTIYSGLRKFGIYKDNTTDSIKTGSFTALKNTYYSIYVVGEGAHPEFLTVIDSLETPSAGKAQIRFLNLGVNTPASSLNYGVDSTLFSNVSYKGHTAFVEIPGGKKYNLTIKSTANGTDTLGKANNVLLESGKIYSVWTKGIYNSTVDSLKTGIKVQLNN